MAINILAELTVRDAKIDESAIRNLSTTINQGLGQVDLTRAVSETSKFAQSLKDAERSGADVSGEIRGLTQFVNILAKSYRDANQNLNVGIKKSRDTIKQFSGDLATLRRDAERVLSGDLTSQEFFKGFRKSSREVQDILTNELPRIVAEYNNKISKSVNQSFRNIKKESTETIRELGKELEKQAKLREERGAPGQATQLRKQIAELKEVRREIERASPGAQGEAQIRGILQERGIDTRRVASEQSKTLKLEKDTTIAKKEQSAVQKELVSELKLEINSLRELIKLEEQRRGIRQQGLRDVLARRQGQERQVVSGGVNASAARTKELQTALSTIKEENQQVTRQVELRKQEANQLAARQRFNKEILAQAKQIQNAQEKVRDALAEQNRLGQNFRVSPEQERVRREAEAFVQADPFQIARQQAVGTGDKFPPEGFDEQRIKNLNRGLNDFNKQIRSFDTNRLTLENFGRSAALALRRYSAFLVSSFGLFRIINAFRRSSQEFIEFERNVTRIRQVLIGTGTQIEQISDRIQNLAIRFGTNANELAQGVFTFAQAGFKTASDLNEIADQLAKVPLSATFDDISSTAEGLLAVFGQFRLEATETGRVLDLVNKFAADFAVASGDIFQGVKRGGAAFAVAGGDVEDFIALFSVLRETSRESAETLGTFFKSGTAQLLQQSSQQLIRQLVGEDRASGGLVEQLIALSDKLVGEDSPFDEFERINIARQLTGQRQFSRLLSLLRGIADPEIRRRLEETLNTASGSFDESISLRLDDIGVSLERIRRAFASFVKEILDNDGLRQLVKDFSDATTSALSLARALAPLVPLLGAFAAFQLRGPARRILGGAGAFLFGQNRRGRLLSEVAGGGGVAAAAALGGAGVPGGIPGAGGGITTLLPAQSGRRRLNTRRIGRIGLGGAVLAAGGLQAASGTNIGRNLLENILPGSALSSGFSIGNVAAGALGGGLLGGLGGSLIPIPGGTAIGAVIGTAFGAIRAVTDEFDKIRRVKLADELGVLQERLKELNENISNTQFGSPEDVETERRRITQEIANRLASEAVLPQIDRQAASAARRGRRANLVGDAFNILGSSVGLGFRRSLRPSGTPSFEADPESFRERVAFNSFREALTGTDPAGRELKRLLQSFINDVQAETLQRIQDDIRESGGVVPAEEFQQAVKDRILEIIEDEGRSPLGRDIISEALLGQLLTSDIFDFRNIDVEIPATLKNLFEDISRLLRDNITNIIFDLGNLSENLDRANNSLDAIVTSLESNVQALIPTGDAIFDNLGFNLQAFRERNREFANDLRQFVTENRSEIENLLQFTEGTDAERPAGRTAAGIFDAIIDALGDPEGFQELRARLSSQFGDTLEFLISNANLDPVPFLQGLIDADDLNVFVEQTLNINALLERLAETTRRNIEIFNRRLAIEAELNSQQLRVNQSIFDFTIQLRQLSNELEDRTLLFSQSPLTGSVFGNLTQQAGRLLARSGTGGGTSTGQLIRDAEAASIARIAAIRAVQDVNLRGFRLGEDESTFEEANRAQFEFARQQQLVNQRLQELQLRITDAARAADLFRQAAEQLESDLANVGRGLTDLTGQDLNRLLGAFQGFVGRGGFADPLGALGGLNRGQQQDLLQVLGLLGNVNLGGGVSGGDLLQQIFRDAAIPFIAQASASVSGLPVEQEIQRILQEIADAEAAAQRALQEEQRLRQEQIQLVELQRQLLIDERDFLNDQQQLLSQIAAALTNNEDLQGIRAQVDRMFNVSDPQPVSLVIGRLRQPVLPAPPSVPSPIPLGPPQELSPTTPPLPRKPGDEEFPTSPRPDPIGPPSPFGMFRTPELALQPFSEVVQSLESQSETLKNLDVLSELNSNIQAMLDVTSEIKGLLETAEIVTRLEISPIQVNVALTVPDILTNVGPLLQQQILSKIGSELARIFGDDPERASRLESLGG